MDAVNLARAGYYLWDEVLRELILEYQNRNEEMPTYLLSYAMDLTRGFRPSRKSGRHPNIMRDLIICMIVRMVVDRFSLRPTRNRTSSRPCACSVVAAALDSENMAMSVEDVMKIWNAQKSLMTSLS
jgi:hypothetical protein